MLLLNEWIKPTRTLNFRFNLYIVRQFFFIRYSHRKKKRSINYLCYKASWHKHVRTIQVAVNKWKTQLYEANSPYKYPVYKIDVKFSGVDAPFLRFQTFLQQIWRKVCKLGGKLSSPFDLPIYRVVVKLKRHVSQINWTQKRPIDQLQLSGCALSDILRARAPTKNRKYRAETCGIWRET